MNSTSITLPFNLPYYQLGASANNNNILNQSTTTSNNNMEMFNSIPAEWQNASYDAKDMVEIVECLKATGLLDDVSLSDQLILDEFCDDLKLPPSERRFSTYAARRMSDFITRRFSLLPNQGNSWTKPSQDDSAASSDNPTSQTEQDIDGSNVQKNHQNDLLQRGSVLDRDMQLNSFAPFMGQNLPLQFNNNNMNQFVGNMPMSAELYIAIHDRLRCLKQEEIQLNLLLQTSQIPLQTDHMIPLLDMNQGLDLESQQQLRRMSLLAAAEAIGLPAQDLLNIQLSRRNSLHPFLDSMDLNQAMLTGGMNIRPPMVDWSSTSNYHIEKPPVLGHQRESSGDTAALSLLDEVDAEDHGSNDPQEQRRGSLDLLGTVAAAASENSSPHTHSTNGISAQESMMVSKQDDSWQPTANNRSSAQLMKFQNGAQQFIQGSDYISAGTMNPLKNSSNISIRKAMDNLKQAMLKSQTSQRNIQKWDKQFGLKRSHSMTMTKTTKSRNQLKAMLEKMK